ncbi:hypothetical protein ABPG73_022929 [Tetrahymena malaccensis]
MIERGKKDCLIMKSVLVLAEIKCKDQSSQRNILNKWFQDSVKNYIFEQIASPLIAKNLKCGSSSEVKAFIHQNIDKSKPKYMSIIDQYFFHINTSNKRELFIERLNEILFNPIDISQYKHQLSLQIERTIRKQFVCYLILRFFESYGQFQNPSFYELWNFCFPEQAQIKKKLSRYDSKEKYQNNRFSSPNKSNESCQNSNILINFEAEPNFSDELCGLNQQYMATCSQSYVYNNIIDNHIPQLTNQQLSQQCQSTNFKAQKKQINNGIISEDEDDDDYQLVSLTKNNLFSQSFYLEKSNSFKNQQQLQKYSEDYNIWYPQLDQKQFYQRNEFQNFSQEKQQQLQIDQYHLNVNQKMN